MLKIHVGGLFGKPQGTLQRMAIDQPLHFAGSGEPIIVGNVSFRLLMIKLPHEINVQMKDFHAAIQGQCTRCLKIFIFELNIPAASREFIIDLEPDQLDPGEEVDYVEKRTHSLFLDRMVREEILLHSPPIPLCSLRCRGLCDKCGTSLNESPCQCVPLTELPKFSLRSLL